MFLVDFSYSTQRMTGLVPGTSTFGLNVTKLALPILPGRNVLTISSSQRKIADSMLNQRDLSFTGSGSTSSVTTYSPMAHLSSLWSQRDGIHGTESLLRTGERCITMTTYTPMTLLLQKWLIGSQSTALTTSTLKSTLPMLMSNY